MGIFLFQQKRLDWNQIKNYNNDFQEIPIE